MPKLNSRQSEIWDDVNSLCGEHGAALVSQPGVNPVRLEIRMISSSDLPQALFDLGHRLRLVGTNERLAPRQRILCTHNGEAYVADAIEQTTVAVYELVLP